MCATFFVIIIRGAGRDVCNAQLSSPLLSPAPQPCRCHCVGTCVRAYTHRRRFVVWGTSRVYAQRVHAYHICRFRIHFYIFKDL